LRVTSRGLGDVYKRQFYKQAQPGTQLTDVLRSREKRLAIEQASLDALRTYHLARIRFNAALGH
jgi:hypothetical protein